MKKTTKTAPKKPAAKPGKKTVSKRAAAPAQVDAQAATPATQPLTKFRLEFSGGIAPVIVEAYAQQIAEDTGKRMAGAGFSHAVKIP